MNWLLVILLSCAGTEMFLHLPIARSAALTLASGTRAGHVILSSAISDHWKEKVMPVYALQMGRLSLTLTGCFLVLAGVIGLLVAMIGRIVPDAAPFLTSGMGLAFSLFVSVLYYQARRQLVRP